MKPDQLEAAMAREIGAAVARVLRRRAALCLAATDSYWL